MNQLIARLLPTLLLGACASGTPDEGFRQFQKDVEVQPDRALLDMRVIDAMPVDMQPIDAAPDMVIVDAMPPECVMPADCPQPNARCLEGRCFEARDADQDGTPDDDDNCRDDFNPEQIDWDGDGVGNACDRCSSFADDGMTDCPADLPPCVDMAESVWLWAYHAQNDEPTEITFVPGLIGQAVRAQTEAAFEFILQVRATAGATLPAVTPEHVVLLSARGVNMNMPTWQGEFPEVRLVDTQGRKRILKPAVPRLSEDGTWETFAVPIGGDAEWIMQDDGADLNALRAIEISADTWESGFELSVDGLTFARAGQVCFNLPVGVFGE